MKTARGYGSCFRLVKKVNDQRYKLADGRFAHGFLIEDEKRGNLFASSIKLRGPTQMVSFDILRLLIRCPKRVLQLTNTIAISLPFVFALASPAVSATELNLQSMFPTSSRLVGDLPGHMAELVSRGTNEALKIKILEPGTIASPLDTLEAVAAGKIELAFSSPAIWSQRYKERALDLFSTTWSRFSPEEHIAWMREEGGPLLNSAYEQYGVLSLPCGMIGAKSGGWFRQRIESPEDLRGVRIRTVGPAADVFVRLGANPTGIPAGEVYNAMQTGVIDAFDLGTPYMDAGIGITDLSSFHLYYPSLTSPYTLFDLIINPNTWAELSEVEKVNLRVACESTTYYALARSRVLDSTALESFRNKSIKVNFFSATMRAAFTEATDELEDELSTEVPEYRELRESQEAFKKSLEGVSLSVSTLPNQYSSWNSEILDTEYITITVAYARRSPSLTGPSETLRPGTRVHALQKVSAPGAAETWLHFTYEGATYFAVAKNFEPASFDRRGGTIVDQPKQRALLEEGVPKTAIVVGVSDYDRLGSAPSNPGDLVDLRFAERDAEAFAAFLESNPASGGGWRVHSFIGDKAKKVAVMNQVSKVLSGAQARQTEVIYLYFAGHGRSPDRQPDDVYLLPYDFEPDDPYDGMHYSTLRTWIAQSKSRHIVFFVDACRSGVIGFGARGQRQASFDQGSLGLLIQSFQDTRLIFTSGDGPQPSWEDEDLRHGVFTYYLLEALNGAIDDNQTPGYVDVQETLDYLSVRLEEHHERKADQIGLQQPRVWPSSGAEDYTFPLAVIR